MVIVTLMLKLFLIQYSNAGNLFLGSFWGLKLAGLSSKMISFDFCLITFRITLSITLFG